MHQSLILVVLCFFLLGCATHGSDAACSGYKQGYKHKCGGKTGCMYKDGKGRGGKGIMMSPEMHQAKAKMHQEMADCLKSKKSKEACREIMKMHYQKICSKGHKGKSCPMKGSDKEDSDKEEAKKSP